MVSAPVLAAAFGAGCSDAPATASTVPSVIATMVTVPAPDSTLSAATGALAAGRPWEATRLLTPLLRDPARRTPAVVMRAAEAAFAWEGHTEAIALLEGERWLDSAFAGAGHALLARAALSVSPRSARMDSVALRHARRALASGAAISAGGGLTNAERGARQTLLARAFDRLRAADSARAHYREAATLVPEVHDWLVLRAARLTEDDRTRGRELSSVRTPAATERRDWTEADARELGGDEPGAAAIYHRLGARAAAFRLQLVSATDSAAREPVRRALLDYIASSPSSIETRAAIELFDLRFRARTADEEVTLARAASTIGWVPRALTSFQAVSGAKGLTDRDRMTYGDLLFRAGRSRDAAAQFAALAPTAPMAGNAGYQRARALLRAGDATAARALLASTRRQYAADTMAASSALYLLGDLASDAARDDDARRYFLELARVYPTSSYAAQGRFRAAITAYAAGNARQAARELDSLHLVYPAHAEALASMYWAGRAWSASGSDTLARTRWRAVIDRNPASYYAMLAAKALRVPVWAPAAGDTTLPRFADIDAAMTRAVLLDRLGMHEEARLEDDWLSRAVAQGAPVDRMVATAHGFAARGLASRAIGLARRALDQGAAPTRTVYRLLYPLAGEEVLRAESRRRDVDPALAAALIRQESNFTARATSAAGARGLMQVMPPVGAAIARSLGFPRWDPVLLYQPDVNVQIGMRHLSTALARYPHPAFALAAYNAGDSRVRRWTAGRGASNPELFVERIPYVETRDYVRIILRNREMYRDLYGWTDAGTQR
ncbi:MAG: transglycosylase SLT domain-containing protein [Gemmatimonadota bacterium]